MLYTITAIIFSLIGYWIGLMIGKPFNLESMGVLFAILIMGGFNIYVTCEEKETGTRLTREIKETKRPQVFIPWVLFAFILSTLNHP